MINYVGNGMLLSSNHINFTEINTVELQWLEHLWNYENLFRTGVVPANECKP